ncbi:MAG: tetratricopeptide repeat protein [Geobacteraceae bacterium]|nr:tetratricopeptide repeat protein [Geobacteraceae bacterium]
MNNTLKHALALQEKGDLPKAKAAFKQILKKNPADVVAHYSLGVIALKNGDPDRALKYFDRAAELKHDFAQTWLNRGIVLQTLQRDTEALASYNRALEIDPQYSQAQTNRDALSAIICRKNGSEGKTVIETLEDMRLKALLLQESDQLAEARALFKQILEVFPSEFVSLYSMAVIALKTGTPSEAMMYADRATEARPNYAPAWYNRGTILYSLKRNEDALADFDRALSINPLYVEALVNRGAVLQELNRHVDAVENFNRLLEIDPQNEKALANKGILLTQFKRYDEAIIEFEKLLAMNPDCEYLLGQLCFAYLHICKWDKLEELSRMICTGIRAGKRACNSLALMAISDVALDHLLCARTYSSHRCPPSQDALWKGEHYNHEKIRLAYVSPDFRQHPVGHLMAGIFENHDKSKFEIISISLGIDDQSGLRRRFMDASDKFIDAREMNSSDIAKMMRSLEVDIAVDLAGYTADSRTGVFALRPAPVQVNYLGYAGTMGAEYMDYILADRHVIPEDDRINFSEKVVYLPDTYLPTDGTLRLADRMPTREEYGLPSSGFIFCSFNHDYKINPPMFDVWMRLLKRIPGSVLWLMKLNGCAEANLIREAEARGVDPGRMIFATRVPNVEDHLARYQLAGLFLDTTPYNAHTTASDALLAGLPVLTCEGKAFPGRVAGSLLHAIGLPELIAGSLAEYEELAVRLATDATFLDGIKVKLRANKDSYPLFNTVQFCRNLESAFSGMFERSQSGKTPESFSVVEDTCVRSPTVTGYSGKAKEKTKPTAAILIPVYQEKLNAREQFSIDFLVKNVTTRKLYFIAPESLDKKYYARRYKKIEFKSFADTYFESIVGYNHLLLDVDFYKAFCDYDYMLIHQTDALMFHDNLDYWMGRRFDYIGAPWPNGVEVNLKVGKFCEGNGVNLKAYVGNGGFSLRSIISSIEILNEFEEIKNYWIKCGSSEDLFFAFMGMVSDKFTIPNQVIASRFSMELEPERYYKINAEEVPTGCHAWWKHDLKFWEKIIARVG